MFVHRLAPLVAICAAAASVAAAGSPATASASSGGAAALRAALAALHDVAASPPPIIQRTGGTLPTIRGLRRIKSTNWSGYADIHAKGHTYTEVSGDWTQPAVTCPATGQEFVYFWVGLDGYSSGTVEQDGTWVECYEGTAHYGTFWEMYPNPFEVAGTAVKPGDKIAASVLKRGIDYYLTVTDSTTPGNNISTSAVCASSSGCADSSAEWIAEKPASVLPDFGKWTESSAAVTSGATAGKISTFPDAQITLWNGTYHLATPSPLNSSGNGFTVTWDHSN